MLKILLNGALGKMGKSVMCCAEEIDDAYVVAGIDKFADLQDFGKIKIYNKLSKVEENFNVILDFSHASGLKDILSYAVEVRKPLVIATTGQTAEDLKNIESASKYIPIFKSANMSLGVSTMLELVKKATELLQGWDITITETHHNQKVDAPSGTAIMIDKAIKSVDKNKQTTILSIRGGNVVGEHEANFYGQDETIKIVHTAQSKSIFALGAINACKFLFNKAPGLYDMKDLISEK